MENSIYEQMKGILEEIQPDVEKFYDKGNKTAGTRIRKAMQTLKALAQDQRNEVTQINNQ